MPYRDEVEALRARVQSLEQERDGLEARLERTRAGLASVVAWMAGLPAEAGLPWRSLHGGEPVEAVFVNPEAETLTLVLVGHDGREHVETTIVGGGEHRVATHTGHLYRLRRGDRVLWQGYVREGATRLGP
ncbi:MAG: hypothetical protein KC619_34360 [Myxococcales bacterium]|nr:hypothetical protein [Myxococcales bacterium]